MQSNVDYAAGVSWEHSVTHALGCVGGSRRVLDVGAVKVLRLHGCPSCGATLVRVRVDYKSGAVGEPANGAVGRYDPTPGLVGPWGRIN